MLEHRDPHNLKIPLGTAAAVLIGSLALGAFTTRPAWAAPASPAGTLSGAAASRAQAVSAPSIDAPPTASGVADQAFSVTAAATDPDADDILTFEATGGPPSLSLNAPSSTSPATATLNGTLASGDVGAWSILWTVNDGTGGSASATTELTVGPNHDPIVDAPATVNGAETVAISFAVTAGDPDGDPIGSFTASSLPTGASFTPNAFKTVGGFAWTPAAGQQGSYTITFSATSGSPARTAFATTVVNVAGPDRIPVINSPGTVTGRANQLITFSATASDPDGDAITSFIAQGTQNTPLPTGALWTVNGANTAGTFNWTPTQAQVANYGIDLIAYSGSVGLRAIKVTRVNVLADRSPVVSAPASVSAPEGSAVSVNVTASDPDGQAIASLTASGVPMGATFSVGAGNTSAQLNWTPGFQEAGSYPVTFTAANVLAGSATTTITVTNANRAPSANAGGPYSGTAGVPVTFNGSASGDPDGDALRYAWDFGDGGSGTGSAPSHTYMATGTFTVSLTVTDNGTPALSGTAAATATITSQAPAHVFQSNTAIIKLNKAKDKSKSCFQVEPGDGSYNNSDVVLASIVLVYGGRQGPANTDKTVINSDLNLNGIQEIRACFTDATLRQVFAGLPSGDNRVTVAIEGNLTTGGRFHGETEVLVRGPVSGSEPLAASVAPNPLNPEAKLYFTTSRPGSVKVEMFDLQGRRVRLIQESAFMAAGAHEARIDGRDQTGARLSSGVYFYRVQAAEGTTTGRFSILK